MEHINKYLKKEINFFMNHYLFDTPVSNKIHQKIDQNLSKTNIKSTKKIIKHKNIHYKIKIKKSNFFYESLPFDTPVSNKIHTKKKKRTKFDTKTTNLFQTKPKDFFFFFFQKPIQTHQKNQELK
jgi:hypothetical protein